MMRRLMLIACAIFIGGSIIGGATTPAWGSYITGESMIDATNCGSSKQRSLPSCVNHWKKNKWYGWGYWVHNGCDYPVKVRISIQPATDRFEYLSEGEKGRGKGPLLGWQKIEHLKCCDDADEQGYYCYHGDYGDGED